MTRALRGSSLLLLVLIGGDLAAVISRDGTSETSKMDFRARWTLARLRAGDSVEELRAARAPVNERGELDVFIVGPVTRGQVEARGGRVRTVLPGVMTAFLPPAAVEALARNPSVLGIEASAPARSDLDAAVPTTNAPALRGPAPSFAGLAGQGVVVADVDTGVDFLHEDFLNPDGSTRLLYIWDQTDNGGPPPADPADPQYGTEWTAAQIDTPGVVRQEDIGGHGTHVLSIAGGDGSTTAGGQPPFVGMAPKADLIMVRSLFSSTTIVDGVSYVFNRAANLGKPAVVNLSLSSAGGPRDGTSAFETALNLLPGPGRIVTKSAGNGGNKDLHAEATLGGEISLAIAGSGFSSSVVLEGYYEASERLILQITSPGGLSIGPVPVGGVLGDPAGAPPGQQFPEGFYVYAENGYSLTSTGDKRISIKITSDPGNPALGLLDGAWGFRLTPETAPGPTGAEVDLWLLAADTQSAGFALGNSNEELIGEPGNAPQVITVGSWTTKRYWTDCHGTPNVQRCGAVDPGYLSPFSSPGPTRDGRPKPDIAAPGSVIAGALPNSSGVITCPPLHDPPICPVDEAPCPIDLDTHPCTIPDGSNYLPGLQYQVLQGTSMSAPMAAGAAALIMQKCGPVTPDFIKSYLASKATADAFTGPVWNKDWGHGKLNLGDLGDPRPIVVFPNGGEQLVINSTVTLRWTATASCGPVTSVDLLLSRTGPGGPFSMIATNIQNTGSHPWPVTGPKTSSAYLKVVARDGSGNSGSDLSDAAFSIARIISSSCCPPGSYCQEEGIRCTHDGTCGPGGCCNYSCATDWTCTGPDPCPENVCGGC